MLAESIRIRPIQFLPWFSPLEWLTLFGMMLAVVGVAVPMRQPGIHWCPRAAARQDMDTLRQAIQIYEMERGPLTASAIPELVGPYLQELPQDPWGAEYVICAENGLILTLGSDKEPGGEEEAADIIARFRISP